VRVVGRLWEIGEALSTVLERVQLLGRQPNVFHPSPDEIRDEAERYGVKTRFGSINFVSSVKNRSAQLTVVVGSSKVAQRRLTPEQARILESLPDTLEKVHSYMEKAPFVCVERRMGDNPHFTPHCTLYVSVHRREMIRLAYMFWLSLFDPRGGGRPSLYVVDIPEWHEKDRQILVFPEIGVTYILGSDYYGEVKKGFLRMAMWHAKQEGMLGLHAGSKIVRARDRGGRIRRYGMLILGLTATGKTTHICHDHGLRDEGEGVEILQDDVVLLRPDGSALGTERSFYLKTEGLNPVFQSALYRAATSRDAVFENVLVDHLGNVHFDDGTLTTNGRGIIPRSSLGSDVSSGINLPSLSELDGLIIIFITRRNTVVPIISKLSLEQAAAVFMLGESVETSGSDPTRAGEPVHEVGMNPFIIGDPAEEGNRFYEFLRRHPGKVQCYLLNTGGVGEIAERDASGRRVIRRRALRVRISESAAIIRAIVRGAIRWRREPYFGTLVPEWVDGVDIQKFDPAKFYTEEQLRAYVEEIREDRARWLQQFPNLHPAIKSAFPT